MSDCQVLLTFQLCCGDRCRACLYAHLCITTCSTACQTAQLVAHISADAYSVSVPNCSLQSCISINTLQSGVWSQLCLFRHPGLKAQSVTCFRCECREFGRVAEPEARLGLVAMQLGQVEEAKKLFTCAARPDLLNKLLQVCVC